MALSLVDCKQATLVDWTGEWTADGKEKLRNPIKRGVIVKVVGDGSTEGSVREIWVKFRHDEPAVMVPGRELTRYLPHTSRYAKEAFRRVMGIPKNVGAEIERKTVVRRKVHDALSVTPRGGHGVVRPEQEAAAMEAMGFVDSEEPTAGGES